MVKSLTSLVKKKKHSHKTVSFDKEVVPKHVAEQILQKESKSEHQVDIRGIDANKNIKKTGKRKSKRKFDADMLNAETTVENIADEENVAENTHSSARKSKVKRKKLTMQVEAQDKGANANSQSGPKVKESIRQRKRKRYTKLAEEKKLKSELSLQQKSINYLSIWKHNRQEWKFEKLRQIWLQNNMYDSVKVPEDMWPVLIEYFNNCRGQARNIILQNAVKLVEQEDEGSSLKLCRARDIVQSLQE